MGVVMNFQEQAGEVLNLRALRFVLTAFVGYAVVKNYEY